MPTQINSGITQLQSPVLPVSLVKTEPLTAIKNEPPEYEIAENGMDDIFVSLDDIKDIDIVSHMLYEDSVKSETVSKDILESNHLESVETQVIVKVENAPFVKIENLTPKENLTENARDGNVSKSTHEEEVEVQGSNEDFNALDNLSQSQNFAECYRTCETALSKKEKIKISKAPAITVEPHEYISLAEDKHICNHCQSVFNKFNYVKFHIKQMHREVTTMYQCSYCPFKSKWKTSLQRHIIQKHKDIKDIQMFECLWDKCDYKTHTLSRLKRHKSIHFKPEEIQYFHCYHCSHQSNRKDSLIRHIKRHFKNENVAFHCYICDFMTPKRDLIIEHLRKHSKHHSQYDESTYKYLLETPQKTPTKKKRELRYFCDKCDYKAHTRFLLKRHKLTHAKPEEIQYFHCYHCSKKCKQKGHIQIHIFRHFKRGEVPFHCYICDFMTPKRELIIEHLGKHSKHHSQYDETKLKYLLETRTKKPELRYRCDVCGYKTHKNLYLNRHKLIHLKPEEIQYFHCYHCSHKSNRKDKLKCHISRHFKNEEVAFHCYICDFMTLKKDWIAKHIRKHSKVQIKSEIKEES